MKKRLLLFITFSSLTLISFAQNLLTNGSFEIDFTNWQNLSGGTSSASFAIETLQVQDGAKAMRAADGHPKQVNCTPLFFMPKHPQTVLRCGPYNN
ncbi:MAG: hypothetical protein MUE99_11985 [Chitinophagaceae bacterium]|nr:hypothetical protein [Chitinophagaceae bacterium]